MFHGHGKEGDTGDAGVLFMGDLASSASPCPGEDSPEEAFAAFTGHSVEVKACGSVSAHPTDSGHVPVKITRVRQGSAGCGGLHPCKNGRQAEAGAGVSARDG